MAVETLGMEDVPLSTLHRFPGNARVHAKGRLQASVKGLGQFRSIVVREMDDGSRVILAGNGTADALEATGEKTARVELLRCTDAEARQINLADNRLSDLAEDDPDALNALAAQMSDDELELTGWDRDTLAALLKDDDLPGPDDAPEDDVTPRWGVIVECGTEDEQTRLLDELGRQGLDVRALMN